MLNQNEKSEKTEREEKTTHFGYQSVREDEKEGMVHRVFKNVAETYDLMNDAMSLTTHRMWKDHFVSRLRPYPGMRVLDVAGGTGDITFRILKWMDTVPTGVKRVEHSNKLVNLEDNSEANDVVVVDINRDMLNVGENRAVDFGLNGRITWLEMNAEDLKFPDNSFDAYTIVFGIRNCTHIDKVLDEAYRVLKPGGRFLCMEFSHVSNPVMKWIYDQYSFQVIPVIGQVVAQDWKSYQYLVESIRQFPKQKEFLDMIQASGFSALHCEDLVFGAVAIHSGFKL